MKTEELKHAMITKDEASKLIDCRLIKFKKDHIELLYPENYISKSGKPSVRIATFFKFKCHCVDETYSKEDIEKVLTKRAFTKEEKGFYFNGWLSEQMYDCVNKYKEKLNKR